MTSVYVLFLSFSTINISINLAFVSIKILIYFKFTKFGMTKSVWGMLKYVTFWNLENNKIKRPDQLLETKVVSTASKMYFIKIKYKKKNILFWWDFLPARRERYWVREIKIVYRHVISSHTYISNFKKILFVMKVRKESYFVN